MSGTRHHRSRRQNERLVGFECQDCGWVSFPEKRRVCKRCSAAPADFEAVQLAERGTVRTFVVQDRLPDEFETPQPLAIVDIPQADVEGNPTDADGDATTDTDPTPDGEPARVYGLLTETSLDELEVGTEVEARFRELFTVGERPVHSFKFAVPRTEKRSNSVEDADRGADDAQGGADDD